MRPLLLLLAFPFLALAQPKPPAELEIFKPAMGAWKVQETVDTKDGPKMGQAGDARFRWGPGRMFVIQESRTTGPNGVMEGMVVYGYEAAKKRHFAHWYAGYRADPELLSGRLVGGKLVYEGRVVGANGKPAHLRITVGPLDAQTFRAEYEYGPNMKTLNERWTATYTRAQPPAP